MTDTTEAVVETPTRTRRFHVKLPSLTTIRNTAVLGAAAGLGAFAHAKLSPKKQCPLEVDTDNAAGTTDN